ncbi:glycoside hydrolase family 28 protein [Evansella sp. AB-rgal1]|uniref:glycoside hydrolase family 28 protein n=1 Tax=Evansella sp. AB-rgal1 TaxID=3242696 RepID=UPI00359D0A43
MFQVTEATGCSFNEEYLLKEDRKFDIRDFGAGSDQTPVQNTRAINSAIEKASETGGTVIIPKGDFRVYTILLKSGVNLFLSEGSVLHAAKTDIKNSYELQVGEGGNYEEPEVNPYVGLQDHGHTYFANSLIYGADIHDVMIYGPGLLDGSFLNDEGELEHVLMGGDPHDPVRRNEAGHQGEWFGNKAIALVRCENVAFCDFSILAGGHFAIITTCVKNMFVNNILVDTNRDAFDIDCCENVTVRNSTFNSLTDDAIVMKASYGGGLFMPLKNVLIEDCKVYGYDMGSVYSGEFTTDKLIATDRCGPTARVKLGTESTCGYDIVTVRRVQFKRSRGFALEAVDGADLSNIIFENSTLEDISSSPIFIKVGDRGRFPVTGNSTSEDFIPEQETPENVRLDNINWVLPAKGTYQTYPAKRYLPSYNRDRKVSVDGQSFFEVVDQEQACRVNTANFHEENGKYYTLKYDATLMKYVPDYDKELTESELVLYANANGSDHIAYVHDIIIRNISVKNVDPRYPIELMGLDGNRIKNVLIENVQVEYRGGLSLEHAVEQRQLNTNWEYSQNGQKQRKIQPLPWFINTFFLKNEGLLPRVDWDAETGTWKDSPFNVPELPEVYPEPSNWGILPAYGLYARHVENLYLHNIKMHSIVEDTRYPVVLDDVVNGELKNMDVSHTVNVEEVVFVTNHYKRPAGLEYVPDYQYHTTTVENVEIDSKLSVKSIEINSPAPGTPKDSIYSYETVAVPENGYTYACATEEYPLPQTVYRPFFKPVPTQSIKAGETLSFDVIARQPAFEASTRETDGKIYNETVAVRDFTVQGISEPMVLKVSELPVGANFDSSSFSPGQACSFTWTPTAEDMKEEPYIVTFIADDGIIPVEMEVAIKVI